MIEKKRWNNETHHTIHHTTPDTDRIPLTAGSGAWRHGNPGENDRRPYDRKQQGDHDPNHPDIHGSVQDVRVGIIFHQRT